MIIGSSKQMLTRQMAAVALAFAGLGGNALADGPNGAAIYEKLCLECHGKQGEGVPDKADEPLQGERSLEGLARYIDKNMPEDKPELCDAEESKAVAAYIYEAFYSPAARARLNPPKIAAARLTNRQFQESIADWLGSFAKTVAPGEGRGLAAQYFQSDGMNKKSKKITEREDRSLSFDFGEGAPVEGCSAEQYSIAWSGSLLAQDTGWHEFKLSTPNGARVYLNGEMREGDGNFRDDSDAKRQPALIDAWVSSGTDVRELTAKVYLLGGRSYPFRLDYFKYKDKRGMVKLEWKRPHAVWEVLSAPYLSPEKAAHVAVVTTGFPADDASEGYERGTEVSKGWHEATTKAAIEMSNQVAERLRRLANVKDEDPDRVNKLKEFIATLAERAFRRPLTPEQRALYVDRPFADGTVPDIAVKRAVMLLVKSPRFLFPEIGEPQDDYATATRLALALWDSLPDAPLLEAAKKGELKTPEQIKTQATRMIQDPRSRAKLRVFFEQWFAMDDADDIHRDEKVYPGFDANIVMDLRRSLELFVEQVVWGDKSDYRELLQADYVLMNERLAKYYGVPDVQGPDFRPVKFESDRRAGIFTHPFVLTRFSYNKTSSPIHRGVFLSRKVMGRQLKSPPIANTFDDLKFDPTLTMREKVTVMTRKSACQACHVTINPLGFSLENFDAVGRFRTVDNNKPVDTESQYTTVDGQVITLKGPRDLANHTASSETARRGFIKQLFQFYIKQTPTAYGVDIIERLDGGFSSSGYHVRNLIIQLATEAALGRPNPNKTAAR